jgi:hypothetical protein
MHETSAEKDYVSNGLQNMRFDAQFCSILSIAYFSFFIKINKLLAKLAIFFIHSIWTDLIEMIPSLKVIGETGKPADLQRIRAAPGTEIRKYFLTHPGANNLSQIISIQVN